MASISNPWKGLSSYTEGEIIYGRDKDIENLFTLITTNKEITILYGQSGIGKTSLLRAGLFPWLRSSHIFPVYVRLGHDELDKSYVDQVIESVEEEAQKYDIVQTDLTNDTDKPKSLWEFLHRYDFHTQKGEKCVPMIFFDQFEELFTISSHRTKYVDEFIKDLGNILNETTPDYLLASTKGKPESNISEEERNIDRDKEPDLNLDIDLEIDEEEDNSKFKTQRDFLLAISIREDYIYNLDKISSSIPALKRNRYFLHGLDKNGAREVIKCPVKNLVDDLVTNEIIEVCHNDNEKYISPAFLSLLMYNLFDRMQQKGMSTIYSSLVSESIGDIFYSYYVNAIKGLPENTIDFLEDRLVSKGGFRLAVPVSDANAAGVTDNEINQLESKRLIVRSKRGSHDFIELTHDLLCKEIAKDKEERDKIKKAQQNKNRLFIFIFIALVLIGIAIAFRYQSAQLEYKQSGLYINQSRAVAAKAEQLIDQGDTYTATMLALEVLPKDLNKPNRPYTVDAERALRRSVLNSNWLIKIPGEINCMAVSPDEKKAAIGLEDGSISLWDLENGVQIWKKKVHPYRLTSIAFSPDGEIIVSSSDDTKIQFNNTRTGEINGLPLTGHSSAVFSLAMSPDGTIMASISDDGTIRIWDVETRSQIQFTEQKYPTCVTFSPDGGKIATGSYEGFISIREAKTLEQIGLLDGDYASVQSLSFSPDGKAIVAGYKNGILQEWDCDENKPVGDPIKGHTWDLRSVKFSPDGERFASCEYDGTLCLWDRKRHTIIGDPLSVKSSFISIAFSNDGDKIYSCSDDNTIRSWDLSLNKPVCQLPPPEAKLSKYECDPQGKYIALNYFDSIIVHDSKTGKKICKLLPFESDYFKKISFFPSEEKIITISDYDTIRIWDIKTGEQIGEPLIDNYDGVNLLALSPDGRKLVTSSIFNSLSIWDLEMGEQTTKSLGDVNNSISHIFFSPDSKSIITASYKNIRIYDSNNFTQIGKTLKLNKEAIEEITISPDGAKLIFSTLKENIYIYDIKTGNIIKTRLPGNIMTNGDIFSKNGKYFVSYFYEGENFEIRIFDINTGQNVLSIPYKQYAPKICAFSEDGRQIITFHSPGDIYNFEFKPLQELMDEQRERFKDRKLTPEERRQYYLE